MHEMNMHADFADISNTHFHELWMRTSAPRVPGPGARRPILVVAALAAIVGASPARAFKVRRLWDRSLVHPHQYHLPGAFHPPLKLLRPVRPGIPDS